MSLMFTALLSLNLCIQDVVRRLEGGSQPHCFASPKDGIDMLILRLEIRLVHGEIERFDQSELSVALKIESLLINSANGQHTFAPELHQTLEKYCIDVDQLKLKSPCFPTPQKLHLMDLSEPLQM